MNNPFIYGENLGIMLVKNYTRIHINSPHRASHANLFNKSNISFNNFNNNIQISKKA